MHTSLLGNMHQKPGLANRCDTVQRPPSLVHVGAEQSAYGCDGDDETRPWTIRFVTTCVHTLGHVLDSANGF